MTKLRTIQSLRGIAAFAVFLCHLFANEELRSGRGEKLTDVWINGAYGVDLFFVISGFIMVWVASGLPRGAKAAAGFIYARATRIYPLWWVFAGIMAVAYLFSTGVPWDIARTAPAGLDGPTHMLKSIFLLPQSEHPVLGVGWTLVHEVYFYIGFAALILFLPPPARLVGLLAWASAVIVGAAVGLSSPFATNFVELIFYPMTLQFVLGALVGYAIMHGWRRHASIVGIIGAVGLVAAFLELDGQLLADISPVWRRTLLYGVFSAMLIYGVVALELARGFGERVPRFMVALGDWSYSLYLCHIVVISAAGRVVYAIFEPQTMSGTAAYLTIVTLATLAAAALSYRLIERPSIRFFKGLRSA